MIKLTTITILAGMASLLLNTGVAFAQNSDPAQCVGASGAAYGLCVAASHIACGTEDESNTGACDRIAANYLKITGETPPWLEYCPCWTTQLLASQGDFEECGQNYPDLPGITAFGYSLTNSEFGVTGPTSDSYQCGIYTDELGLILVSPITEEESASCARQVMTLCPNPIN